jgi:hypothetical protein
VKAARAIEAMPPLGKGGKAMKRLVKESQPKGSFRPLLSLGLILGLVPACLAEDVTFIKSGFSSPKRRDDIPVNLSITDSKILIKSKKVSKKLEAIDMQIPYSSIDAISYELSSRHRVSEGAAVMVLSMGTGAVLMATKTKSHWLAIAYHDGDAKETTVLRLDKSEYKNVIVALEARTGKKVAILDSKTSQFNPVAGSKDMDEVVPFGIEKVTAALKPAMENMGCKVTAEKSGRVECKRARGGTERTGAGGEKVTATLEAKGEQTRVRIWTGKGAAGRVYKKNWSTPIYQEMIKGLQKPAASLRTPESPAAAAFFTD